MASELQVQTISGPPTGANANKILIPSGQTLTLEDKLAHSNLPIGNILQVVTVNGIGNSTNRFTASTATLVNTGFSVSITPKFATSKIMLLFQVPIQVTTVPQNNGGGITVFRNGTNIACNGGSADFMGILQSPTADAGNIASNMNISYVDSPGTTDLCTYSIYGARNGGTLYVMPAPAVASNIQYSLNLLEIAA